MKEKEFILKFSIPIVESREFSKKLREKAKKKGKELPLMSCPMLFDVKGYKRILKQHILSSTLEREHKEKALEEYVKFSIMEMAGIKTYPIEKKVKITKWKELREEDFIKQKEWR